jgi:hypothetical protein
LDKRPKASHINGRIVSATVTKEKYFLGILSLSE